MAFPPSALIIFKKKTISFQIKETEENELRIWDQAKFLVCCWRFHQDSE